MPAAVSLTLPLLSAAAWNMLARCGTVVYGTVSSNRVCTAAAYCAALASGTGDWCCCSFVGTVKKVNGYGYETKKREGG